MAAAHRIYARALFDAAKQQGRLDPVREELGDFADAVRDVDELRALLTNPQVDRRTKAAALDDLLGGAEELVRNFLRLLVEKGRIGELDGIRDEFDDLVSAEERRLDVELTTAYELSDAEASEIVAEIERRSGRTVEARRRVDPDLIGGMILQVGSLRADASVRGRLNRLRHELLTRS